jgi:hypothetical protein
MSSRRIPVLLGLAVLVTAAAQKPASFERFPPPSGYALVNETRAQNANEMVELSNLDNVYITGNVYRATYRATLPVPPKPIDVLRHYRDLVSSQNGIREMGIVYDYGGSLIARVPGSPAVWVYATLDMERRRLEVRLIEEITSSKTALPVPPEQIPGRWILPAQIGVGVGTAERPQAQAATTRIVSLLQSLPALGSIRGAELAVTTAPVPRATARASGDPAAAWRAQVFFRRLAQECRTCPIRHTPDMNEDIDVRANDLSSVFEPLNQVDPAGRSMFAAPGTERLSPQVMRTAALDFIVTRPGRPPLWLPVSREDFLRAQVQHLRPQAAQANAQVAERMKRREEAIRVLEKADPAAAKEVRTQLDAPMASINQVATEQERMINEEIGRMSPVERAAPAMDPNGRAIVALNPAYADPTLARGTPQFLVWRFRPVSELLVADYLDRVRTALDPAQLGSLLR